MRTDADVRRLMDLACSGGSGTDGKPPRHGAGYYMRQFAEEVVALRQRVAKLERRLQSGGNAPGNDDIDCDNEAEN